MKKISLYLLTLVISGGLMAQQVMHVDEWRPRDQVAVDLDAHHFITDYEPILRSGGSGAVSFTALGTSYNIYTILLDEQNQVAYDPDINTVAFVHRHNDGTAGGSGGLSFDVSTDGGATWSDQNVALSPGYNGGTPPNPDATGNRYPSITIYNPSGNTDPANAYAVAVGPALSATTGSWGLQFQHSAKIPDGANVSENYLTADGSNTDFHPYGALTNPNGEMWSISTYYTAGPDNYEFFYINKGDWNAGTNSVDWTTPFLTIDPDYFIDTDGDNASGYGWNIAFSPDGMTGYAVFLGAENSAAFTGIVPVVWKSTDGGANWSRLPDFDYRTLTAFTDYLIPTGQGDQIPFFISVDVAVDMNDRLHLHSEVLPRSSSSSDSIYFIWVGPGTEGLFHLHTSDGTDWDASLVDSVMTDDGAVGTVAHGPRTQISSTEDGSKIFFSWAASDDALVGTNDLPNLFIRGYDVMDDEYTFVKNATQGTAVDGIVYFPTMAPTVNEDGTEQDYELHVVFAEPGADDLSPPQYYHVSGAGFDDGDFGALAPQATADFSFTITDNTVDFTNLSSNATDYLWDYGDGSPLQNLTNPTHVYAATGTYNVCLTAQNAGTPATDDTKCEDVQITTVVSGINDPLLSAALELFPSPTAGAVTIRLEGYSYQLATVEVYNMIGERMMDAIQFNSGSMSMDLSNLADGQYIVKVTADDAATTRQITLAR